MEEDMDIDQVVDVPDTPDRSAARHITVGNFLGKESKLLIAGQSQDSDFMDEGFLDRPRARGLLINENRRNRRLHIPPRKNLGHVDKVEHCSNSIAFSPLDNASLFRRTASDRYSKHETRNSVGAQHMDKGKLMCSKFPSKSCQEDNAMVDLTEQNGHGRIFEMAFPCSKSKGLPAKDIREGQIEANSGASSHWPPNFPLTSSKFSKGKEKIGENTSKGADLIMGHGRGIDLSGGSQHNNEKQISASRHSIVSPKVNGQKRLVRNGCISPHNIEIRAKQLAGRSEDCSKDAEPDHTGDLVSKGPCMIDISDLVAEGNNRDRSKGLMIHPSASKEHHPKIIHLSSRSGIDCEEVDGNDHASGDAFGCSEGSDGWRSTHIHSKKVDHPLRDGTGSHSRRNGDDGCFDVKQHRSRDNRRGKNNGPEDQSASQTASRLVSEQDQMSESRRVTNTLTKRQKKFKSASRNHGESSRTVSDDSDIVFIGSSAESSRSRSSRSQSLQHRGVLDIDELSPEIRHIDSQGIGCTNNDDSDARARQLEEDERLARELQEQLYYEMPVFGGEEIDENIAWMLQQEEDALPFSHQNHRVSHPRTTSMHSYRQPQSRLLQSPSNRRGARARAHASGGVTQLRSRFINRSRTAPSRARNFHFPLDMDLDTRLDILEAIEAAFGDFNDIGTAGDISQLQRDFNENDYEMLLALDENNQQNGASANQINSLPLSTVQTDNYEEACAVCLDTPTIGETIRHLPCLHKFHKACIDPWLSRRPSCPVCKSSIT